MVEPLREPLEPPDLDAPDLVAPDFKRAYEDVEFLRSIDARTVRVLAELLQPQHRLRERAISDTIVFFGSARAPSTEQLATQLALASLGKYYEDARELSRRLTAWGQTQGARRFVVCSGGGPGIMEAVSRGAADASGESVAMGIEIPGEPLNQFVTPELTFLFHYFFMRKFWFVYNAKAFVFFPGGFGTMDELTEVLTLVQTAKLHKKVGIVLFGSDFWGSVFNFEAMVERGVLSASDLETFVVVDEVDDAERRIHAFLRQNYGPSLLADAW